MMRRIALAMGVVAIGTTLACGSDQSTNDHLPTLTSAQLALHFDTLAGALQASAPGDIRLTWYQDIASILALGVSPSALSATVQGGPAVYLALTEVDAFADTVNGKLFADSTYRLAAWAPATRPTQFIDLRVRFVPAGTGKPDTTAAYLKIYTDTLGATLVDSMERVALQDLSNRGPCVVTALHHLMVPPNPCTHVAVDWLVGGGTGLMFVNPAAQISGTHLTH